MFETSDGMLDVVQIQKIADSTMISKKHSNLQWLFIKATVYYNEIL